MALKSALTAEELSGLNSGRAHDILKRFGESIDLGTRLNDLSSLGTTTAGTGAALIGIVDADSTITGTNVDTALTELSARVRTQLVTTTLTAAAESGNAIAVTINLVDLAGTAVSRAQRLICRLYTADMLQALAAAWTMAETGAGSEISTTAKPSLLIATDANGDATVTVTDVSGVAATTVYLEVTPLPPTGTYMPGCPNIIALTFA